MWRVFGGTRMRPTGARSISNTNSIRAEARPRRIANENTHGPMARMIHAMNHYHSARTM